MKSLNPAVVAKARAIHAQKTPKRAARAAKAKAAPIQGPHHNDTQRPIADQPDKPRSKAKMGTTPLERPTKPTTAIGYQAVRQKAAPEENAKESKLLRRALATFEQRLAAAGGVQKLAAAIRRHVRRPDVADEIPDEVLAGLVLAQVRGALAPGSFGSADRAGFWRLVEAPWASTLGSRNGGLTPGELDDMGQTIQERVSAAILRAEGRTLGPGGRSASRQRPVTLDAVVDGSGDDDDTDSLLLPGGAPSGGSSSAGHARSVKISQFLHTLGGDDGDGRQPPARAGTAASIPAGPTPATSAAEHRRAVLASLDQQRASPAPPPSMAWLDDDPEPEGAAGPTPGAPETRHPTRTTEEAEDMAPDPAPRPRRLRPVRRTEEERAAAAATPSDRSWPG